MNTEILPNSSVGRELRQVGWVILLAHEDKALSLCHSIASFLNIT